MATVEQGPPRFGSTVRPRTLEEMYEAHAPGLRRRCLRLTHDPDAAEDLMQEVFARFLARFPEVPADMHVAGYLHATARNILWKQLRDGHEVADGEIEAAAGSDDDIEVDPERAALLVEQQRLVRRCSTVLTGRQRRALTLREVEGHSYAEIGSDLGIGEGAVAQVISRARVRLRGAVRRAHVDLDQLAPECRSMIGPLSDYLDGRTRTSSSQIETHLAECEACRNTLAAFKGAGSRLRGTVPIVPIAGIIARIGEAVRLGGEASADAIRAGAVAVVAAVAIGGGGMYAAHELTASAPAAAAHASAAVPLKHAERVALKTTAASRPTTNSRTAAAPAAARGARTRQIKTPGAVSHPRTTAHPKRSSDDAPKTAAPVPSKPAAKPPVTGGAPGVTPTRTPNTDVTRTVDRVATPAVDKVVAPVAGKVVAPVAGKVVAPVVAGVVAPVARTAVDPVVSKVVAPVVSKVVAPATAPVANAVAPVTNAVAPITAPVTKALAPVVAPVTTAVAPVTAPVEKVVSAAVPPANAPASTTPAVSTPAVSTPVVTVPPIKIGLG